MKAISLVWRNNERITAHFMAQVTHPAEIDPAAELHARRAVPYSAQSPVSRFTG
jgi:hypothetical protein